MEKFLCTCMSTASQNEGICVNFGSILTKPGPPLNLSGEESN